MRTPLNVWNSYYGANKTTDTPWVDWREVTMATDFSTTATQALTERYGHTAQQIWGTQRAFPAGPVKVHLTDVSVGQVTNVGFVDRTFIFASYLIGIYRVGDRHHRQNQDQQILGPGPRLSDHPVEQPCWHLQDGYSAGLCSRRCQWPKPRPRSARRMSGFLPGDRGLTHTQGSPRPARLEGASCCVQAGNDPISSTPDVHHRAHCADCGHETGARVGDRL